MKIKAVIVSALGFFGLAAIGFAQATFSVGSIPVTTVTASGNTERTGDIMFTVIQGSSATFSGTITIYYGVPITVPTYAIIVTGQGGFAANPPSVTALDAASGTVALSIGAGISFPASFTVSGVRVKIAGSSLSSLAASISSTGNAIVAGQTGVTVIISVAAGLSKVGVDPVSGNPIVPAELNAAAPVSVTATMAVSENYLDAFGRIPADDPTITTGIMIRFTLSQAPPAGVSVAFPTTATSTGPNATAAWHLVDSAGAPLVASKTITSASTDLRVYYKLIVSSNPTAIDDITVGTADHPINLTIAGGATLPLSTGLISYVVSLAPIQPAFNNDGTVTGFPIPRFAAADLGPATLVITSVGGTKKRRGQMTSW